MAVDKTLDILYIGNFRHPWCTEVHLARELESLGHQVDRFQEAPGFSVAILEAIRRRGLAADIVLWTRTWGLPVEATELWRDLEQVGVRTASYHLDLYLGLKRSDKIATDPFWTTGLVFTPDGNQASQDWFRENGINHRWVSPAVVSDEIGRGTFRQEYACDLAFVGTPQPPYHPEWPWRGRLIEHLRKRGARFFGGHFTGEPVRGQDLNDLYASAKIVVGDSISLPGNYFYISDRYFETLGRGGFLLAPDVPILTGLGFKDGLNIALYEAGNVESLDRQIDYYLAEPERRRAMVDRALRLIEEQHTYRHRMDFMISEVMR